MSEQETADNPTVVEKQVYQYQPVDEQGNAIGRPTRIEYETPEELIQKMEQWNQEAVRTIYRLKSQKAAPPAKQEPTFKAKPLSADEEFQAGLEAQMPAKFGDAVMKVVNSRLPITDLEESVKRTAAAERRAGAQAAMFEFIRNHPHDFYNCHANGKMMGDWIIANGYDITSSDSIEAAFAALQDSLAVNPSPAPAAEPTHAATVNPTPQARTASSGLVPGGLNGVKPVKATGLSKKAAIAIIKAKHTNPAEYRRYMNDPALRAQLDKALAS
jgi:hypothetical protein